VIRDNEMGAVTAQLVEWSSSNWRAGGSVPGVSMC